MVTRWNEKSPGLKILWIWTFGTAAILIGNVMRTRMNDMEKILREEDRPVTIKPQSNPTETILED